MTIYHYTQVSVNSAFDGDIVAKECIKDINNRWNRHATECWPSQVS